MEEKFSVLESNLLTYSVDEIVAGIKSGIFIKDVKGTKFYSFYITPKGRVLNCRYPNPDSKHSEVARKIYKNFDKISNVTDSYDNSKIFNSVVDKSCDIKEVKETLMRNVGFDNLEDNKKQDILLKYLGDDEVLCQDMGFVKILIVHNNMEFCPVLPLPFFNNKSLTVRQEIIIDEIAKAFSTEFAYEVEDLMKITKRNVATKLCELKDLQNQCQKDIENEKSASL